MARAPYNEQRYRDAAKALRGKPCWRCGEPGTTADHIPPLAVHRHVGGSGCCVLHAACSACNSRGGAALGTASAISRGSKRARQQTRVGALVEDVTPPVIY